MGKNKPHLSIPIDDDLRERLKLISVKERISITKIVVNFIESYVEEKENEYKNKG